MDTLVGLLQQLTSSPWLYVLVFVVVALDAFFPVVPSETLVITAGVFATGGSPDLVLLVVVAAVGAFVGDHVSYRLGRGASGLTQRLREGRRGAPTLAWAETQLRTRGGMLLAAARFIPGGRTATTVTAGALRYPRRRFLVFVSIAAVCWSAYASLIGYWGGSMFEEDPIKGLVLGVAVAMGLTCLAELARRIRPARRRERAPR